MARLEHPNTDEAEENNLKITLERCLRSLKKKIKKLPQKKKKKKTKKLEINKFLKVNNQKAIKQAKETIQDLKTNYSLYGVILKQSEQTKIVGIVLISGSFFFKSRIEEDFEVVLFPNVTGKTL